jgi:hypothetical protein
MMVAVVVVVLVVVVVVVTIMYYKYLPHLDSFTDCLTQPEGFTRTNKELSTFDSRLLRKWWLPNIQLAAKIFAAPPSSTHKCFEHTTLHSTIILYRYNHALRLPHW